jgi:hypothetical protein
MISSTTPSQESPRKIFYLLPLVTHCAIIAEQNPQKPSEPKPEWVENRPATKKEKPTNPMHPTAEVQTQDSKLEISPSDAEKITKPTTKTEVEATKGCCLVM